MSVSKLGQALSGVAADAFKHLDSKARGALENLVNSGQISADDAVLGLRSMATQATFSRYSRERPRDQEDDQRLAASGSMLDKQRGLNDRMGAAREAFGQAFSNLQKAQESGELSMDQVREGLRPAQEEFDAQMAAIGNEQAALGKASSLEAGYEKTVKGFNAAMGSMISEDGFTEAYSEKANGAAQKLQQLGFDAKVFGNAFQNFAATVDIPGIGSKAGAAAPKEEPAAAPAAAPAAPAAAVGAEAADPVQATAAEDSGAGKPAAVDRGNAQAALSMLRAAASGTQKSGSDGILGALAGAADGTADTAASGLLDALKSGAGKAGPDDGKTV
ncbi:hypothetical protein JHL17_36775 [Azospirillum sp. YIM B02556]|uniref:Phage tail tape measure protein n=1 Tax=Azospirillum endophyticum TaxID=2800326 RepID=A0ABS1FHP5_9PROT|nr:hypothetical protein [Azospirillum endophyticum]